MERVGKLMSMTGSLVALSCAVQRPLSKVIESLFPNILMKLLCQASPNGKERGSWLNHIFKDSRKFNSGVTPLGFSLKRILE